MKINKRCRGCSHWVKVVRIHLETSEVDVSRKYCDSQETTCGGCCSNYPNLTKEEILEKIKDRRLWKFR